MGLRRLAALTTGLPPDAAIWRHQGLPPVERLLNELNRITYELALARMQQAGGTSARIPAPPERLMAPGAEPERPENVVSIREFAQRNKSNVRVA